MQVIQKLPVLSNPPTVYQVGEVDQKGREIIEIRQVGSESENQVHSEYLIADENGNLIASVENCPVIVEYQVIAIDDDLPF